MARVSLSTSGVTDGYLRSFGNRLGGRIVKTIRNPTAPVTGVWQLVWARTFASTRTRSRHAGNLFDASTRTILFPRRYAVFDPCGAGSPSTVRHSGGVSEWGRIVPTTPSVRVSRSSVVLVESGLCCTTTKLWGRIGCAVTSHHAYSVRTDLIRDALCAVDL